MNLWQLTYTILKRKLADANSIMMHPTIRMFIKGLKNVHTLATTVYEKGPQSLADAIKEVEKLQATQQLTATLIPSSSVNVMSHDDDKCFQCQESGHMACHCPHIKCFHCDEYGHVTADYPDKIPPSGTPARQRNTNSNTRYHDRSTSHHDHQDRHSCHDHRDRHSCHNCQDRHGLNRSRSHSCSHRYRSHSWSDSWRSHSRSYHRPTHHSTYWHQWDTLDRRSSSHRSFSRYCSGSRPCTSHKKHHITSSKPSSSSNRAAWKNKDRTFKQVTIDDLPSKYYSSDELSSKSDEDLN